MDSRFPAIAVLAVFLALGNPSALSAKTSDCSDPNKQVLHKLLKGQTVVSTEVRQDGGPRFVKASILVNASPKIVWDTIHAERKVNPDLAYSKVLEQNKDQSLLEEKFVFLPVIGTATCIMRMAEVPLQRIDYKLIKSDHFRAMEGSWVLTSHDGGRSTILELSSHLKLGFAVPSVILEGITSKKLEKRVTNVKNMAEREARLAQVPQASET